MYFFLLITYIIGSEVLIMDFQLKKIRKRNGMTQEELAQAVGTTKKRVGDWERLGNIKFDDACSVADYFKISLDELAGRWDYVGAYSDERQRRLNEAYAYLDDSQKDSAVGSVEGMASVQARKKAACEGPAAGERSA